ncbi:hypothetical protein TI04_03210 [Achromatium sp. WMS2]|nr:hypothetical protein TI04_03210 [Achromatium sp. WMS2]
MSNNSTSQNNYQGLQWHSLAATIGLGSLSVILYILLFEFADYLVSLAAATRHGDKLYAVVPLVLAMVFAFVYGTFIDYLWNLLGLRSKR